MRQVCSWFTALILSVFTCGALNAQQTGALHGTVSNAATQSPVEGAIVSLRGTTHRTQSGGSGAFVLRDISPGNYTVVVNAIGMAPYQAEVVIEAGKTAELALAMIPIPVNLRAVVVTASKTQTEIRDIPASVSVLTSENITESGATNFTEAIKAVPGVSVGSFGENFNSIQLRGLPRFGNENEAVLILLDGVPQTDARNSSQLLTLPIDNVDHVEVVKGPNSALYGRTAIGGVINIITQDPGDQQQLTAKFQGGQWGFLRGTVTASGPISPESKSGYVLSWTADRHDSFQTPGRYSRRESSLFGKFRTIFDSATSVVTTVNYVENRGGTPTGDPLVNGKLLSDIDPRFSPYTNLNLPTAQYNEDHLRAMNRFQRILSPVANITNTFGYRHDRWNFLDDGDFLQPPNPGQDTVTLFPFTRPREEDAYYDDLRLELNFGSSAFRNRVQLGGTFDKNTGRVSTQFPFTDPNSGGVLITYLNPSYPGLSAFMLQDLGSRTYAGTFYGAYAQDQIAAGSRLRIDLGLRYDDNKVHALTSSGVSVATADSKVSPKVGLTYHLLNSDLPGSDQLSVYAQYARAFKPPNAPAELAVALDPNNPLAPETVTNYEVGLKGSTFNNHVAYEVSAFDMLRDGIRVLLPSGSGISFQESSAGKQRFKGLETGVTVQPVSAVQLHANYAFYDGKYEHFTILDPNNNLIDLSGLRVNLSPRHMLDVGGTFDRGHGLGLTLSGYYEGDKALDAENTYFLSSYFVANGRVSWRWQKYVAAVSVTNIFNKFYATDGEISAPLYVFPAPPRRFIAEFDVTF
jgi:TonB-dependent siderophore receptor